MFAYNLSLSLKSILKDKFLSSLMVLAIALGVGLSMTIMKTYMLMSGDPISEKSEQLNVVRLDSWDPLKAFREPNIPPFQLTYQDVMALRQSDIPVAQAAMFRTGFIIQPDKEGILPYSIEGRVTDRDFFSLFNVTFQYGGTWSQSADDYGEQVVVLGKEINDRVFGGEDSVGRTV